MLIPIEDVWKCATITSGVQSVMMTGDSRMVLLHAGSWDGVVSVRQLSSLQKSLINFVTLLIIISGGGTGTQAYYGQGVGQIWLDQVRCQGYERRLFDCPANPVAHEDCTHAEDASTYCSPGI